MARAARSLLKMEMPSTPHADGENVVISMDYGAAGGRGVVGRMMARSLELKSVVGNVCRTFRQSGGAQKESSEQGAIRAVWLAGGRRHKWQNHLR